MRYLKVPFRLFYMLCDETSEITDSHIVLYGRFSECIKRGTNPIETRNLYIHEFMEILGWKKQYFYKVLRDLIRHEFVERVYDKGRKRSELIKIRFLPDP